MTTAELRAERKRIAEQLRRYFEDGTSTFRGLLDYLDLDYVTGMDEGWLDFNNAVVEYEDRVEKRAREEATA